MKKRRHGTLLSRDAHIRKLPSMMGLNDDPTDNTPIC